MNIISKWIFARRRPAEYCAKYEHDPQVWERVGYVKPNKRGSFRTVAYNISERRVFCRRCDVAFSPWKVEGGHWLNGLGLPPDQHRSFEKYGCYWISCTSIAADPQAEMDREEHWVAGNIKRPWIKEDSEDE